jgi:hypothetical protein
MRRVGERTGWVHRAEVVNHAKSRHDGGGDHDTGGQDRGSYLVLLPMQPTDDPECRSDWFGRAMLTLVA